MSYQVDRAMIGDGFEGHNDHDVVRAVCAALTAAGFDVEPVLDSYNGAHSQDGNDNDPGEDAWLAALGVASENLGGGTDPQPACEKCGVGLTDEQAAAAVPVDEGHGAEMWCSSCAATTTATCETESDEVRS